MATIDIKLKSYDELIFEITKLNTDKYLLEQENKQLKSILTELEEWLKEHIEICKHNANIITEGSIEKKRLNYRAIIYDDTLDKIQELKEKYK